MQSKLYRSKEFGFFKSFSENEGLNEGEEYLVEISELGCRAVSIERDFQTEWDEWPISQSMVNKYWEEYDFPLRVKYGPLESDSE
jgi:hypothetical protein